MVLADERGGWKLADYGASQACTEGTERHVRDRMRQSVLGSGQPAAYGTGGTRDPTGAATAAARRPDTA